MTVVKTELEIYELEKMVASLDLSPRVPKELKLVYSCAKIQQALQDCIDASWLAQGDYNSFLERPYETLLLHSLECLKLENISLKSLLDGYASKLDDQEVFTLSEYSIRRFEFPESKVSAINFKDILRSIISNIIDSEQFDIVIKKIKWN